MKLATVFDGDRDVVAARLDDDTLAPVESLIGRLVTMRELIRGGDAMLDDIQAGLERAEHAPDSVTTLAIRDVSAWRPPIPAPGKVCAVAMNNSASNERKISAPDHPAFFLKPPSCLIGHLEPVRIRPYYGSVHPEPELALAIARETRDVGASEALKSVFGYMIFNDVTSNRMRAEDRFHYWAVYADESGGTKRVEQHLSYAARYKGSDTFGVLGPWLVTADEIADPDDLGVHCAVGGESVAEDSTSYYNFKVAEVVSFLSHFMTLHPGDVISLGTAFRPGSTRKSIHEADFQRVAGPVEIRIDGLGLQQSPVVLEDKALGAWRLG